MLVVDELVADSVLHGRGERIHVQVTVDHEGRVGGEVEEKGGGEAPIREIEARLGGYGRRIVDALVERWAADRGCSHVWFEMHAAHDH